MQIGEKALQALSLRGGKARQDDLAADIGLAADRLAPVLAGLHHNGYVVRNFTPTGVEVRLTEDGTNWLSKRGRLDAARPSVPPKPVQVQPQAQPRPVTPPQRPLQGEAKPAPQQPSGEPARAAPAPAAERDGEPPRRRTLNLNRTPAQPQPQPSVAEPAAVETLTAPEPVEDKPARRPRRRKGDEEVATDESGFVTHIKGKAIF